MEYQLIDRCSLVISNPRTLAIIKAAQNQSRQVSSVMTKIKRKKIRCARQSIHTSRRRLGMGVSIRRKVELVTRGEPVQASGPRAQ